MKTTGRDQFNEINDELTKRSPNLHQYSTYPKQPNKKNA